MALISVLVLSASGWFVLSRFDSINTLSDLPDTIQMSMDNDGTSVEINTGPALLALQGPNLDDNRSLAIQNPFISTAYAAEVGTPSAEEIPLAPKSEGVIFLLVGVDAGAADEIDVGVRPTSLSVLHLDPDNGTCRALGIPRDARVNLPGYGLTRINHALAVGGVPYQQMVIEQYLGISVDHYGLVDFESVESVVNAVGGITVNNPDAFTVGDNRFAKGEIDLNGEQALQFSRYHERPVDRQQLVLRAVLRELGSSDAVKAVPSLLGAAEGHFKTDLSALQMVRLANSYRTSCTNSTLETRGLHGKMESHPDPLLNSELSYVIIAPQDIEAGVRWLIAGEEEPGD